MNETINIEQYGTYPSTGNHSYFISFYIDDLPPRILIWQSCDYDVNPATDMNDAMRQDRVRQNYDKSIELTGEMQDKINEFNKLLMEIE